MDAVTLSKKNQKKIQKFVKNGQKHALKANKKAEKVIKALPASVKPIYTRSYSLDDLKPVIPGNSRSSLVGVLSVFAILFISVVAINRALKPLD